MTSHISSSLNNMYVWRGYHSYDFCPSAHEVVCAHWEVASGLLRQEDARHRHHHHQQQQIGRIEDRSWGAGRCRLKASFSRFLVDVAAHPERRGYGRGCAHHSHLAVVELPENFSFEKVRFACQQNAKQNRVNLVALFTATWAMPLCRLPTIFVLENRVDVVWNALPHGHISRVIELDAAGLFVVPASTVTVLHNKSRWGRKRVAKPPPRITSSTWSRWRNTFCHCGPKPWLRQSSPNPRADPIG